MIDTNCTMNSTTYTNSDKMLSAIKANTQAFQKRLQNLYPCVDDISKLPQAWSTDSKAQPLGLTYDNLGCYYRGNGRRDEDEKSAAAVRTDQHIPPSCLLYYFEIKCISKGREGRMGVGLAPPQVALNKLPGWIQGSYGYHAEDGNLYNSEYKGQPCGPPSTSGDVIGCGYNLVEGRCFFTKNGLKIGKTFDCIPSNIPLHPTIGLKTPGEEIRANFGQEGFLYDIEQDLRSLRKNMTMSISNYPISDFGNWQSTLHELVQTWLLQNSYPSTAEAFTRSARIECKENLQRAQQRNKVQQLVLSGKISEAIRLTNRLCPNLLNNNPNLLFALKCRQFIELISGAENDFQPIINDARSDNTINGLQRIEANGDQTSSLNQLAKNNGCNGMLGDSITGKIDNQHSGSASSLQELMDIDQPISTTQANTITIPTDAIDNHARNSPAPLNSNNHHLNQQQPSDKMNSNGNNRTKSEDEDCELEENNQKFSRLLQFGRELSDYLQQLDKLYGKNEVNEKMLHDAIGLIAYSNPQKSHFGKLLDPREREPISQLLNSSIVKAEMGESYKSPLEDVMNHLRKLIRLNDSYGRWLIDQLY